jgi:hypothetical protein
MKTKFGSISLAGIELTDSLDADVEIIDPNACTFADPGRVPTVTYEMAVKDCRASHDFLADAEWQRRCRRELSPMFGWTPMPVAYATMCGTKIPLEEIGQFQDGGECVEVAVTVWRHWP